MDVEAGEDLEKTLLGRSVRHNTLRWFGRSAIGGEPMLSPT